MKNKHELHIISTGRQSTIELVDRITHIHEFINYIHLREKNWTASQYTNVINELYDNGVPPEKIIINDRIDVAHVMACGGVHLGYQSIETNLVKASYPDLRIGCSVHSLDEAIQKEESGADYLVFGHVFKTDSKPGLRPRGLAKLKDIVQAVNIPVIAIGGIKQNNISNVIDTGATGIAVLSGILLADHSQEAVRLYRKSLKNKEG